MTALTLPHQHVHIWLVDPSNVTDPHLLERYHRLMTPQERAKWERYKFEKDKHQHLVTRALIREALSRYEPSVDPADWHFELSSHGKPTISNALAQPLFFNLSHTQDLAALAVTRTATVGVDVERIKSMEQVRGLAERCFTEEETRYIFGEKEEVLWRFFRLWTLKEAYLKARGCGMSLSLQALSFSPRVEPVKVRFDEIKDDDPELWQFQTWQAGHEHLLSLAINQPPPAIKVSLFHTVPLTNFREAVYERVTGR